MLTINWNIIKYDVIINAFMIQTMQKGIMEGYSKLARRSYRVPVMELHSKFKKYIICHGSWVDDLVFLILWICDLL